MAGSARGWQRECWAGLGGQRPAAAANLAALLRKPDSSAAGGHPTRLPSCPRAGAAHPHFVAAAAAIVREEGAAALVNGLPLSLVKIAPQTAVTFAVYEVSRRLGDWRAAGGPRRQIRRRPAAGL